MRYFYNYSFLTKWMEANGNITNKQIMKAMGTTSNACLDTWIRMKSPLPTNALLRFCNAFHVPLSAFILNADANPQGDNDCYEMEYVRPGVNDQFEPDGGYIGNEARRQNGTRALRDPLDVDRMESVVPGWTSDGIAGNGGTPETTDAGKEGAMPPDAGKDGAMPSTDGKEEMEPAAPDANPEIGMNTLNRMLDIIAEQQKTICDQQKLIAELTRRLGNQQTGFGMVAEEIHHDE